MKPNLANKFSNYKIVKTFPPYGFYAKFIIYHVDEIDIPRILEVMDFNNTRFHINQEAKTITFFIEVLFFAHCVFDGEANDDVDFGRLDIKDILKNEDIYFFESLEGFVCEDTGGDSFEIVMAEDLYDRNGFHLKNEKTYIAFRGYTKNIR